MDWREGLSRSLCNPEYRAAFADESPNELLAASVLTMREQRGWTRAELAKRSGVEATRLAQLEDPNTDKSDVTLRTLKQLAAAFDVALVAAFVPFEQLVERLDLELSVLRN